MDYINFLLESKSISDSCVTFNNKILKEIIPFLKDLKSETFSFSFSSNDFNIKDLIMEFIVIDNKLNFNSYNKCEAITLLRDATIDNDVLENVKIVFNINLVYLNSNFIYYIKSIILHELVHCFQYYNIAVNNNLIDNEKEESIKLFSESKIEKIEINYSEWISLPSNFGEIDFYNEI